MFRIFRISAMFFALTVGLTLAWAVFPVLAGPVDTVLYAAPVAAGAEDCSSWADACTLQTALSNAVSGDQIWVQAGVHKPGATVSDTFALVNGVAVYGGFDGTETALDQRDWETNITVLSGDVDNNDVTDPNGVVTDTANIVGDNAYHVVSSTGVLSDTVLDGFTITAGQAHGTYPTFLGAGLYSFDSHLTLANLTFQGNYATSGGGIYNLLGNLTLTNVSFIANFVTWQGGGLWNQGGDLMLTDVVFTKNSALSANFGDGGGCTIVEETRY